MAPGFGTAPGTPAFGVGRELGLVLAAFTQRGNSVVAKATKHPAAAQGSKLLQRFAKAHGCDIQTEPAESISFKEFGIELPIIHDDLNPFVPQIRFGDKAVIVDPSDDPVLIEMWGSKAAVTRTLRNTRIKEPLLLVLFLERKNSLYKSIGFDISSYGDGSRDPNNPNNSNWGRILHRVGLRYFDGDDGSISFLFPSRDKTSVALALALAGPSEVD